MSWNILITNCKGLVQVREQTTSVVAGNSMAELPILEDSFLAISGSAIADFGPMSALSNYQADEVIDATGSYVFPSFVDSHTHLVYAASREEEFVMKIKGGKLC